MSLSPALSWMDLGPVLWFVSICFWPQVVTLRVGTDDHFLPFQLRIFHNSPTRILNYVVRPVSRPNSISWVNSGFVLQLFFPNPGSFCAIRGSEPPAQFPGHLLSCNRGLISGCFGEGRGFSVLSLNPSTKKMCFLMDKKFTRLQGGSTKIC